MDAENESFRVGIHDALLTQLARVGDLRVISRTSVLIYDGETEKSIPEIASELGVSTVVEGSVQRAENMVQINVQLIDGETDDNLWADFRCSSIAGDAKCARDGEAKSTATAEVRVH